MRLTLRTLLSYLDDMLEPAEAKLMGAKVAESEVAPELIERIAKVTRRRGLSAPAVTGEEDDASTDPNTVAEYLDNALPTEQVEEIEQAALDSDARLAEVSACHQILTLVLGEPAKVPPTARQRMYRVVKGKESVPYRKPSPAGNVAGIADPNLEEDERAEADENPLLGITGSRVFVAVAGSLVITLLLIGVISMAIPTSRPLATQGYVALGLNVSETEAKAKQPDLVKKDIQKPELLMEPRVVPHYDPEPIEKAPETKKDVEPKKEPIAVKKDSLPLPDPERRSIARLESKDSLLLQRRVDALDWERALPAKDLFTADTLLSLPGNQNDIRLESGARLQMWGAMPEYHQLGSFDIMESRMKLHVPPIGIDADFTLESGRVFIRPPVAKGDKFEPSRVRIRFKDQRWEIVLLDPDAEVCVDLFAYYDDTAPFSKQPGGPAPTTEVYLGLLNGHAGLKLPLKEYPLLEAPTRVTWDSAHPEKSEPRKVQDPKDLEWWSHKIKDDPATRELQNAAAYYVKKIARPDIAKIDVVFYSAMLDASEAAGRRIFALRALQAIDAYEYLPIALADDVFAMRRAAIRAVQHWTALAVDRDLLMYRELIDKKGYTPAHAQYVMQLLHPFSAADYTRPEIASALFDALNHDKTAIRELAYQHLEYCDPQGAREIGFLNAAVTDKGRDAIIQKWNASWKRRFLDK